MSKDASHFGSNTLYTEDKYIYTELVYQPQKTAPS